jgi:hypothetical protein
MYVIVSYRKAGRYRYWTGRTWARARRRAGRYAVRSVRFINALASAQQSQHAGIVGLLRQGE